MENCIFCQIIKNMIPSDKIYEDAYIVAFRDINPVAKIHIIVIPKICHSYFHETENNILIHVFNAIKKIVKEQNLETNGYRLINNNGEYGGQSVNHIHFHIIGGEILGHKLSGY